MQQVSCPIFLRDQRCKLYIMHKRALEVPIVAICKSFEFFAVQCSQIYYYCIYEHIGVILIHFLYTWQEHT